MMLCEVGVHDPFLAGVGFDSWEELSFLVVVVRVHHLVEALAVGEEVGDVGREGELRVLQGYGVESAEHDVVGEAHVACGLDCWF